MGDNVKGVTFNDGDTVTGALLNNLVDDSTWSTTGISGRSQQVPTSSDYFLFLENGGDFKKCTGQQLGSAISITASGSTLTGMPASTIAANILGSTATSQNVPIGSFNVLIGANYNDINNFRLTLQAGSPVMTGNAKAATVLYVSPYNGNNISLYDGTNWNVYQSAEISAGLTGLAASTMYDVFAEYAGSIAVRFLPWTNDTTRATALTRQNGILSLTGSTKQRYLGSLRTLVAGSTECSFGGTAATGSPAFWLLYNEYNQVPTTIQIVDSSTSWTDTTTAYKSLNASGSNRCTFVLGQNYNVVNAEICYVGYHSAGGERTGVAIGLDATNAVSGFGGVFQVGASQFVPPVGMYEGRPTAGLHFLQALQRGPSSGTSTFEGASPNGFIIKLPHT